MQGTPQDFPVEQGQRSAVPVARRPAALRLMIQGRHQPPDRQGARHPEDGSKSRPPGFRGVGQQVESVLALGHFPGRVLDFARVDRPQVRQQAAHRRRNEQEHRRERQDGPAPDVVGEHPHTQAGAGSGHDAQQRFAPPQAVPGERRAQRQQAEEHHARPPRPRQLLGEAAQSQSGNAVAQAAQRPRHRPGHQPRRAVEHATEGEDRQQQRPRRQPECPQGERQPAQHQRPAEDADARPAEFRPPQGRSCRTTVGPLRRLWRAGLLNILRPDGQGGGGWQRLGCWGGHRRWGSHWHSLVLRQRVRYGEVRQRHQGHAARPRRRPFAHQLGTQGEQFIAQQPDLALRVRRPLLRRVGPHERRDCQHRHQQHKEHHAPAYSGPGVRSRAAPARRAPASCSGCRRGAS